ncbi:MAG TPA: hypothetical protein VGO62_19915, partial [Myxococcota bacterium]
LSPSFVVVRGDAQCDDAVCLRAVGARAHAGLVLRGSISPSASTGASGGVAGFDLVLEVFDATAGRALGTAHEHAGTRADVATRASASARRMLTDPALGFSAPIVAGGIVVLSGGALLAAGIGGLLFAHAGAPGASAQSVAATDDVLVVVAGAGMLAAIVGAGIILIGNAAPPSSL